MSKKRLSLIAIIIGLVLLVVSLTADLIGLGSYPGINWAQIVGAVVGLATALLGFWLRNTNMIGD